MTEASSSTRPKPFVFVLMPLAPEFKDIYTFGIKGAADDVGAYAERIDEQIFVEGILDRIFNQINKADVVVADMTGRNANVFYEVGYAHALGKIVLLLTQHADDIPFDLKHKQHTVYGGNIELLRSELKARLQWAIVESKRGTSGAVERVSVKLHGNVLTRSAVAAEVPKDLPTISGTLKSREFWLPIDVRNDGAEEVREISHVYLFRGKTGAVVPVRYEQRYEPGVPSIGSMGLTQLTGGYRDVAVRIAAIEAEAVDAPDGLSRQHRLPVKVLTMPPGATEQVRLELQMATGVPECDEVMRLRLHLSGGVADYWFRMHLEMEKKDVVTRPAEK